MTQKILFFLLVLSISTTTVFSQCGPTNLNGNQVISSNTTWSAGTYNITGDFTINSGVTLTVSYSNDCPLTINANNITILGTINANGAGARGGAGGGAGGSSGGAGGGSLACGGGGGSPGSGPGAGNAGNSGGCASGGCSINCGNFICIGGNDADRAGGGGGSGGSGASYGNTGGTGGSGAAGRLENEPGNSDCGSTPVAGGGGVGNVAPGQYGTGVNNSDLAPGSGGGGAGGGGGGYNGGTSGGVGGNGGGGVNLNASLNLVMGGAITANGTNGGTGGNGGVRSGLLGNWNCEACGNGNGGGSNDCRDASLCGICTYYTWDWPGGAGGGAGAGSGGGIKLQSLGIMTVTGSLQANGGSGGNCGNPTQNDGVCNHHADGGGAGAGGVIKFVYDPCANNTFTPAFMQAAAGSPGLTTDGVTGGNTAGNGVIYNQTSNIYYAGYTPFTTPTISPDQTICSGTSPADLASAGVNGGQGSYIYTWYSSSTNSSGQVGSSQNPATGWIAVPGGTTANLSSATIGTVNTTTYFQVRVQSGPCYVWSNVVTITVAPSPIVSNVVPVNISCNGGSDGSITVTGSGGTPVYTYSDNGGVNYQSSSVFSGLAAASYSVYIKDANNCVASYTFNPVTLTEPPVLAQSDTAITASCINVSDGSVVVTVSGGTPPYLYAINGGSGQTGNVFNNLPAGTYFVNVTDAKGCSNVATVVLGNAYAVTASLVSQSNVSCYGSGDGSVTVQLSGGIPPYSYSINGIAFQASPTFTGLTAGSYTITLHDIRGCTDFVNVQITQPNLLQVQIDSVANVFCFDSAQGAIFVSVSGGTVPYSYHWSDGDSVQNINTLAAGTYNLTVVDSKGCSSSAGTTISQPFRLYVNVASYHNLHCFNDSSGSIETAASGGAPPYTFLWSNNSTFQNIYGLQQGTYSLTVSDANGCISTLSQSLTQPTTLVQSISGVNALCAGSASADANYTLSGGIPPYSYFWNNGATTQSLANVNGGTYVVMAKDANGCTITDNITLIEPTDINIAGTVRNALCYQTPTGAVDIVATGGTPGYTYNWTNSVTTANNDNIVAGNYTVTVVDANGCVKSADFTVAGSPQLIANVGVTSPRCNGDFSGSLTAIATGGTEPYVYLWSGGATGVSIDSLQAGIYQLTVTDALGCTATASTTLNQPAAVIVTAAVNGSRCFNTANGSVIAAVTGGVAPYVFILNGIQQVSDTFTHLPPGNYAILVIDKNGCQGSTTFSVSSPAQISVALTVTDQVILTGMKTQLSAVAVSDTAILNYIWSPITMDSADVFDYGNCTDTSDCSTPYVKPPFTQVFTVTIMNADSCYASDTVTVLVKNQPSSFIPTAFTPNGDGKNDFFEFDILGANTVEVNIFNRWGSKIYSNPNQANGITGSHGWDGTVSGKPVPEDTYVYQLKVTYFDGTVKNQSGTITVMR